MLTSKTKNRKMGEHLDDDALEADIRAAGGRD